MILEATVVKNTGSQYWLSELPSWNLIPAVLRGKIRLKGSTATNPVAVGDRVKYDVEGEPSETNPAVIREILPRKNYVIRKSTNLSRQSHILASNLDQAFIIVTLYFPELKLPFLDRFLVTCEVYGVPVTIVLNKVDMYRDEAPGQVAYFRKMYSDVGYKVLETSAFTKEGIDELRQATAGKVCLFSGESGVGKSSLIRCVDPALTPKVGEISEAHLQGRHTTSYYEIYPADNGAFIIDTPGVRGFGLVELEKEEISKYFPEMLKASSSCRFVPCTHTHEPGCAVKEFVDKGIITPERYNSYLGMLEDDQKFR